MDSSGALRVLATHTLRAALLQNWQVCRKRCERILLRLYIQDIQSIYTDYSQILQNFHFCLTALTVV